MSIDTNYNNVNNIVIIIISNNTKNNNNNNNNNNVLELGLRRADHRGLGVHLIIVIEVK